MGEAEAVYSLHAVYKSPVAKLRPKEHHSISTPGYCVTHFIHIYKLTLHY